VYLLVREQVWPHRLVDRREEPLVGNEAPRLTAPAIETEIPDLPHPIPANAGSQVLEGETPGRERLDRKVGVTLCHQESIEVHEHTFVRNVVAAQRTLERQVVRDGRGERREAPRRHDRPS
jgi:hypothetical protein